MSISKATFISGLARFRKNMLAEITDGWVEDPKDGSTLLTKAQSEKIETTMTDESISDADIDSIFTSGSGTTETTTDGSDTSTEPTA